MPLFAITGDETLRSRLSAVAKTNAGHASHFSIPPTVLEVMGYASRDIAALNGASLLRQNRETPSFTTGDIFGLFSTKVRWHDIDLSKTYME